MGKREKEGQVCTERKMRETECEKKNKEEKKEEIKRKGERVRGGKKDVKVEREIERVQEGDGG